MTLSKNEPLCYLDDLFEDVKEAVARGDLSEIAGCALDLALCNKAILDKLEPLKDLLREEARDRASPELPTSVRIDAEGGGHCVVTFPAKQMRLSKEADCAWLLERLGAARFDEFFETRTTYKPRGKQPFVRVANSFDGTPELLSDLLNSIDMVEPTPRVSFKDS
jgi:hypothetical protein